jgi:hypothetical protein
MKKNIFIAVLFSIVALVSFSSCESDHYEWKRGTLNLSTEFNDEPISTDSHGRFSFWYDLRAEDIGGIDARRSDIVSVESFSSEIFLFHAPLFRLNDIINIRLKADGVNGCVLRMIVNQSKEAQVIDDDYRLLKGFMADMAYNLSRRGQLRFYIEGELLNISQSTRFDFEVRNDFDFEIRY